jgi:hypothetical protein
MLMLAERHHDILSQHTDDWTTLTIRQLRLLECTICHGYNTSLFCHTYVHPPSTFVNILLSLLFPFLLATWIATPFHSDATYPFLALTVILQLFLIHHLCVNTSHTQPFVVALLITTLIMDSIMILISPNLIERVLYGTRVSTTWILTLCKLLRLPISKNHLLALPSHYAIVLEGGMLPP